MEMKKYILLAIGCLLLTNVKAQMFKSVELIPTKQSSMQAGSDGFPASSIMVGSCSETPASALGLGQEAEIGAAVEIPSTMLAANGDKVVALRVYLGDEPMTDVNVFITNNLTGTPFFSKTITDLTVGWNYIFLDEPISNLQENLFLGYSLTTAKYILGLDQLATGQPVSWIKFQGEWVKLASLDFGGSWGIQAVMSGGDYSSSIQYDGGVTIKNIAKNGLSKVNEPFDIKFNIYNNGVMTLTDFDLFVRVGSIKDTLELRNVCVPHKGSYIVEWKDLVIEEEGEVSVAVKIFNLNGNNTDAVSTNNTALGTMGCFFKTFGKNILIEQFTGQDCGYCPQGAVGLYNTIEPFKGQIFVVAHHTFGTDNFTIPGSLTIASRYGVNSAPNIIVDRGIISGSTYWLHPLSLSKSMTEELLSYETPVTIELKSTYDPSSRKLKLIISGYCPEVLSNATVNVWLSQSGIVAYQKGASANYVHKNAIRLFVTPTWGEALVRNGANYENSYEITLPETIGTFSCKEEDMSIVAFISNNSGKAADSKVFNTVSNLLTATTFLEEAIDTDEYRIRIIGNDVELLGEYDRIEMYDVDGRPVKYTMEGTNLFKVQDHGIFVMKIFNRGQAKTRKILIQ